MGQAAADPGPRRTEPQPAPLSSEKQSRTLTAPRELIDPADEIDRRRFPTVYRLAAGLAEDRWGTRVRDRPGGTCSTALRHSWQSPDSSRG